MSSFISRWASLMLGVAVLAVCLAGNVSHAANADTHAQPARKQSDKEARRITPAELREAMEKGQVVIVDVRGEAAYNSGHIKGALLIPMDQIGARAGELPRNKMIVTYCS